MLSQLLLVQLMSDGVFRADMAVAKFVRRRGVTLSLKYLSNEGEVAVYMAMVVSMRKSNMTWSSALVIPAGPKIDVVMAERSVWLVPILSLRYSSMFCLRCLLQLSADDCGKLARIACFIAISSSVPKMGCDGVP